MPRRRPHEVGLDRWHRPDRWSESYTGMGFSARGVRNLVLLERDRFRPGAVAAALRFCRAHDPDPPGWIEPYDEVCSCGYGLDDLSLRWYVVLPAAEAVLDADDRRVLRRLRGGA